MNAKSGIWATWAAIAIVATMAGVLLPRLMQDDPVAEPPTVKIEEKGKLTYQPPAYPNVSSPKAMLLRLGVGTILVSGLAVGSLFAVRRWMTTANGDPTLRRAMRLGETLPLGNRCVLHLVHLGKAQVLVGVDAGGIKSILPMPDGFGELLAEAEIEAAA